MSILLKKFQRACGIWQRDGVPGLKRSMRHNLFSLREALNYQKWVRKTGAAADQDRKRITATVGDLRYTPLISVLLPVYNVDEKWLRLCIESVTKQIYTNWELCIADDGSTMPHVRRVLEDYAAADPRVKVVFRPENGHISAASNSALDLATGEFSVLLDHDDELSADALFWIANEINEFPETHMIFSDEDLIDERGRRCEPKFKPDFSRDLFYSLNMVTHLSAYRTEILRKIDGFRIGLEGSQDYDLALRVTEEIREDQIRHIPRILYHWRAVPGSVALSGDEKPYAHERARNAIRSHFERTGTKATVTDSIHNLHRVRYSLPANLPTVALILNDDTDVSGEHLNRLLERTSYSRLEVVKATDGGSEAERLNIAAARTKADILCFVDFRLLPVNSDWLAELTSFAHQKGIAAVGAKLSGSDDHVLHGGSIIGAGGLIGSAHRGFQRTQAGNMGRNIFTSNFSAVSVSCMTTKREMFERTNGFDSVNLPNRFYDADYCLKLRKLNYRIVLTPFAELIKTDRRRRLNFEKPPTPDETRYFSETWAEVVERDPFYNPNLSKKDARFTIAL